MRKVLLILTPEEYRHLAELAKRGERPIDFEAMRLLRCAIQAASQTAEPAPKEGERCQ